MSTNTIHLKASSDMGHIVFTPESNIPYAKLWAIADTHLRKQYTTNTRPIRYIYPIIDSINTSHVINGQNVTINWINFIRIL